MKPDREIPNTLEIGMFFQCARCIAEKPPEKSPREWARLNVGWTRLGLQVWCVRHECNVVHIDFEGQKHPGNTTTAEAPTDGRN